jgi:hypothetical protein
MKINYFYCLLVIIIDQVDLERLNTKKIVMVYASQTHSCLMIEKSVFDDREISVIPKTPEIPEIFKKNLSCLHKISDQFQHGLISIC